jgi:hypothetical protein
MSDAIPLGEFERQALKQHAQVVHALRDLPIRLRCSPTSSYARRCQLRHRASRSRRGGSARTRSAPRRVGAVAAASSALRDFDPLLTTSAASVECPPVVSPSAPVRHSAPRPLRVRHSDHNARAARGRSRSAGTARRSRTAGWLAESRREALFEIGDAGGGDRERVHELRFLQGLDLGRQRAQPLDHACPFLQGLLAGGLDVGVAHAGRLATRRVRVQVARKGGGAAEPIGGAGLAGRRSAECAPFWGRKS